MKETFNIKDLEQLKAIADPLRRSLLDAFCKEPRTTKQAAGVLGEKPTKLYHHVELLEKTGLIKLVKTKQNRGTIEKYYQSAALVFSVDSSLLNVSWNRKKAKNKFAEVLSKPLEDSLKEINENFDSEVLSQLGDKYSASLVDGKFYLNKKKLTKLSALVQDWLRQNASKPNADSKTHKLIMVVYPLKTKE